MDASSPTHPSAQSLFLHHDDPMGVTISAVRTGRISLKRRVDRHDDPDIGDTSSGRHSKRLREHLHSSPPLADSVDRRFREGSPPPPGSGDTTLVDDLTDEHDTSFAQLKGKARDDMCSSSVVSVLLPVQESTSPPRSPDHRESQLADEIESELRCGCCTEIAYNPVSLSPCHHFFCGSCVTLHLSHSRSAPNYTRAICPACRTPLTGISPSRVVQSLVSALVRVYPERARTERERMQADEIYTAGRDIPIPPPRMPNPDVLLPQQQNSAADNLARPCPHCAPNNSFDWACPRPIPNPETDSTNAWNLENGAPPGHNYCGACDELYAIGAPTSSRCDMCTTGFCGISVQRVCRSHWLRQVQLLSTHNSLQGLIENGKVYEAFNGNAIEVEIMFDYLREAEISPNMIYLDIVDYILATPEGFEPLIASDLFSGSHQHDLHVPDSQYMAERSSGESIAARGAGASSGSLAQMSRSDLEAPSILFADFTDEEDSDGEGDADSEISRRITIAGSRTDEGAGGMMLPRFADLMRSMRDVDTLPSFVLPPGSTDPVIPARTVARSTVSAPSSSTVSQSAPTATSIPSSTAPSSTVPRRRRICRECATEVFTHGLKDWWAREMRTKIGMERLPVWVVNRKMCGNGESCTEQGNYDHSRAYCHITQSATSTGNSAGATRIAS
ncbi:hypothetical protein FRC12_004092 [Ceratobasidium sp. 428]|nr:hypothetical protein FRC12_004092 [Ceratobasidium sp. 428]